MARRKPSRHWKIPIQQMPCLIGTVEFPWLEAKQIEMPTRLHQWLRKSELPFAPQVAEVAPTCRLTM
jgi:hypothetical protein